jgi:hypothetical protein
MTNSLPASIAADFHDRSLSIGQKLS